MKTLYLVRHAQAISNESGVNDFKRQLASEGRQEARTMGKRLARKGIAPDLLIASPADRALETAHLFAEKLDYPIQRTLLREELYPGEDAACLPRVLKELPDMYQTVLLIGHEPSLSRWAKILIPNFEGELRTTGVIGIALRISSWQELSDGVGALMFFDFPVQITPDKIRKNARQVMQAQLTTTIEGLLKQHDVDISKPVQKIIKKASKTYAKKLVSALQMSKIEKLVQGQNQRRVEFPFEGDSETKKIS